MLTENKSNKRVKIIYTILFFLIIGTGIFLWINQTPSIPNVAKFDAVKKDFSAKNANTKEKK